MQRQLQVLTLLGWKKEIKLNTTKYKNVSDKTSMWRMTGNWKTSVRFKQGNTTVKVAAVAKQRGRQKRRWTENNAALLQIKVFFFFFFGKATSQKITLGLTGGLQGLFWVLSKQTQKKASQSRQDGRLVCLNHFVPDYTVNMKPAAQRGYTFFSTHETKQLGFLLPGRLPGLKRWWQGYLLWCRDPVWSSTAYVTSEWWRMVSQEC